jgi:hypothetical protein
LTPRCTFNGQLLLLGVDSTAELVKFAVRQGLVQA